MANLCNLLLTALVACPATALLNKDILTRQSTSIAGTNIQLLPLGDSITYGLTDPNLNGYRGPLYSELIAANATTVDFLGTVVAGNFPQPDNEGHSGYTISQIATAAAAAGVTKLKPNIVLLHAGTNDAFQNTETASAADTLLGNLIDQIYAQWPGVTLLVAKVIPTSLTTSQTYLNTFNAGVPAIQSVAAEGWLVPASATASTAPPSSTSGSASPPVTTPTTSLPTSTGGGSSSGSVAQYGQCGGLGYTGPTTCQSPYTCKAMSQYYSQCL